MYRIPSVIAFLFLTLFLVGCSPEAPGATCMRFDNFSGFTRCETAEVICYLSKGGQMCWPKTIPPKTEVKTPAPEPKKP